MVFLPTNFSKRFAKIPDGWFVFGFALTVRLIYLLQIRANDPFYDYTVKGFDQHTYQEQAREILGGDGLLRRWGVFYYSPLYSYFCAAAFKIGGIGNFDLLHLLHALLGAASCVLVWRLARSYLTRWESLAVGALASLCAPWLFYEQLLLLEVLVLSLNLAVLYLSRSTEIEEKHPVGRMLSAGICSGLAYIGRGNFLLLIPAFAFWIWIRVGGNPRSNKVLVSLYLFGALLPIAALGWRNHAVSGHWIFGTTNGSAMLYLGNSADATGEMAYSERFREAQKQVQDDPRIYLTMLREDLRQQPFRVARTLLRKTRYFWSATEISDNSSLDLGRAFSPLLRWDFLDARLLFALGLIGMALSLPRWKQESLLWLYVILFSLSIILIIPVGRYRIPIFAPMILFGVRAISWGAKSLRNRRWRVLIPAILVGVALWFLLAPFSPARARVGDYRGFLRAALERKKLIPARTLADWSVRDYPNDPAIHSFRLAVLVEASDWTEAEDESRQSAVFPALTPEGYTALARLNLHDGKVDRARQILKDLLVQRPEFQSAHILLNEIEGPNQ